MEIVDMQMHDLCVFALFGVSIPINMKCVHYLVTHILSNHPKSVPFAHQRLYLVYQ